MPVFAQYPSGPGQESPRQDDETLRSALSAAARLESGKADPREQAEAAKLLRQVLRDGDEAQRRRLCEAVKGSAFLPNDIVLGLASDHHSVALPFLALSPLLTEADLVKLVWSGDAMKQATIAARPALPAAVANALAEVAGQRVIQTLLANARAEVTAEALLSCVQRFADDPTIQARLIERPQLPLAVADQLLEVAGPEVQQALLARHAISPEKAKEAQRQRGSWSRWWQASIFAR